MSRRQQYRFLVAASLTVAWIVVAVYGALAALDAGGPPLSSRSGFFQALYLPYTLSRTLGRPMQSTLGSAGGLLAVVLLWIVFTMAIWAVLELIAFARARGRAGNS